MSILLSIVKIPITKNRIESIRKNRPGLDFIFLILRMAGFNDISAKSTPFSLMATLPFPYTSPNL
jgi:hypothetical protein